MISKSKTVRLHVRRKVKGIPRREMRRQHTAAIPHDSALAPFVRHGMQGLCGLCGDTILHHYGHRGVWLGCRAKVPTRTVFMLMPLVVPERRAVATAADGHRRERESKPLRSIVDGAKVTPATNLHANAKPLAERFTHTHSMPYFVYRAKDKRRTFLPERIDTPAMQDALNGLRKAKDGATAVQAAKLAKRPVEANRRCLNALVGAGLAVKVETQAHT